MCSGNRAHEVTYWVNQQLATLWKIAVDCTDKHGYGIKPSKPEILHGTCLAQVCVGKHGVKPCKEDFHFFAEFNAPKIQFICNHDVYLFFRLKKGHFKQDSKSKIETFEEYTCVFRVPFRQHRITDTTYSSYGQTDVCKAKFFILDLNAAEFVSELSRFTHEHEYGFHEVDRKQRAILKYLRMEYLPLLRKAGFHFIHSLPDFDILSRSHQIDWSVVTKVDVESLTVCGINVEVINTFLNGRWLEAAACVDELEDDHDHSRFGEFALSEHRGVCDDFHFHAYFGPPQIRALCSKEVIFIVDVENLYIHMDGGFTSEPHHAYSNWKIAIVAGITFVEEAGSDRRLKLDFSNARYCEGLSEFGDGCEVIEESFFCKMRSMFVHYMSFRYLSILEEFGCNHIYRVDVCVVEEGEYIEEEESFEFSEEEYRERICITETFGFDTLTTVTQASINYHFRCLWKAAQSSGSCLSGWSLDHNFDASFGAIQIQLPCNSDTNSVFVFLTLREGALAVLDCHKKCIGGEMHAFSNWRVAFKVKLKLREYGKTHAISDVCLGEKESVGKFVLRQLVLDFETAKFCPELSRLNGIIDETRFRLTRSKRQALIHYITHYYFVELKRHGLHVLYSFPVWETGETCGINSFAPTDFSFQFYNASPGESIGAVSCLFGRQRSLGNRNMIVICGTVDKQKQRCSLALPRCPWSWCSSQDISAGMMVLSREVFLEGWLLRELSCVNGRTTLIPIFHGISEGGEWRFDLVTLHSQKKSCEWKEVKAGPREIEFEHRNKDVWTYDHVEDSCNHSGNYSIYCETVNKLFIPTVSRCGGCEIKLTGKVTLELKFKGAHKSWSTSAVARWSHVISFAGGALGRGLRIEDKPTYDFSEGSGFIGDHHIVHSTVDDASTLLREKFKSISIVEKTTINQLRRSFCDVWPLFYSGSYGYTLCNPVFNLRGDFILELESPLDCNGRLIAHDRRDVHLPVKHHEVQDRAPLHPHLAINGKHHGSEVDYAIREDTFSKTTMNHDATFLPTPISPHDHSHLDVEAEIVGEYSEDDSE